MGGQHVLVISGFEFRICFGFRDSDFFPRYLLHLAEWLRISFSSNEIVRSHDRARRAEAMVPWVFEHTLFVGALPRCGWAALAALALALLIGWRWVAWSAARLQEPNVSDSPTLLRLQRGKDQTPTMGGVFLIAAMLLAVIAFADLANPYVWAIVSAAVGLAALGAVDDLAKLRRGQGLSARTKLLGQIGVALPVAVLLAYLAAGAPDGFQRWLPGFERPIDLGPFFIPLAVVVIVGSSNAVNLTDGLDGLAGGCLLVALLPLAAVLAIAGNPAWASSLGIEPLGSAGEGLVVLAALAGAVAGFLWFNCHPAQVFMGDAGSLPLGGLLGVLAIVARQEFLLVCVGGVFVAEAVSVMLQVAWFKLTRHRLLRCAPLHHHFQFAGWSEQRVVARFWMAGALCAVIGLTAFVHSFASGQRPPWP